MSSSSRNPLSRSGSSSSTRSGTSKETKKVISTHEATIEDFQGSIDNWEIPRVHRDQIYKTPRLNFLRTNFSIKTEERDIQLTKPFETIYLFSEAALQRHKEKNFKYIHIGLVQVGIKPLSKEGLNTSILAILRDTRFRLFEDSLLSSVESSLCAGPISFDCYPNFTVSLNDKNILKSLVLQIKTHNYDMMEGSIPIALVFRLHYKAMTSAFSSKVKIASKKGETLLLQTDFSKSNSVIPRSIQWKDITLPDEWILEGVAEPKPDIPNEPIEPNTQLKNIEQFNDGKVKVSFIRNQNQNNRSDLQYESFSTTDTIDLGRISQIGQNLPNQKYEYQPRYSTSDIPNSVLRNVDFQTQIPKPVYTKERNFSQNEIKSEPSSPTFSAITDMANELNVIEKDFVINKKFLRKDFYSKNNTHKRNWFFKMFLKTKENIQKEYYDYLEINKIQVLFFDWFEDYTKENKIYYPYSKTINPITQRNKTPEWETLSNTKIIQSNHPPQQGIKLNLAGKSLEAVPFKLPKEDDKANIKNIIIQNNFTNTNLGTISKQLDRIKKKKQYIDQQIIQMKLLPK